MREGKGREGESCLEPRNVNVGLLFLYPRKWNEEKGKEVEARKSGGNINYTQNLTAVSILL